MKQVSRLALNNELVDLLRRKREIVYVDISEKDDHHKKKKMYDKDNTDPSELDHLRMVKMPDELVPAGSFKSVRTGRGPLVGNWQSSVSLLSCRCSLIPLARIRANQSCAPTSW